MTAQPDPARPLRLLLVLGASSGGIGRHVHTLASSLATRGHDVVVCGPASGAALFDWAGAGARFVPAPVGGAGPRALAATVRALRAAAADRDVVHAHGVRVAATCAAAGLGPLVATWHNGPHARRGRRAGHPLVERVAARRADVTLVVSPDLARRARRAGAVDVRPVPVVAPPLPPATQSAADLRRELGATDRPLVVAVGRLEPQKRFDLLIRAVAGWPGETAPAVVIAGTGSRESALRRLIDQLAAPVALLGRRDDVTDLLAAADVVALPSDWEGYPLIVQEALRVGTPLVATAVGGIPDLVADAAVLVPPGDPEPLRDALGRLLADPDERRRLAARGPARAADWPTIDDMVDDLRALYLDLTSR